MLHAAAGSRLTLTGATGFVGRRLLTHIAQTVVGERAFAEQGQPTAQGSTQANAGIAEVRVHTRRPLPAAIASGNTLVSGNTLTTQGAPVAVPISQCGGDLLQMQTWRTLLRDTDVVVHAAGAVRGRNAADFAVNHLAVSALLQAIETLPKPPRILLISSLAARRPELSDYAGSKRQGELNLLARSGLPACILRPPAIYGPGDVEMLPLLRIIARGIGVYPGDLDARVSLLHIDDLCRLILAWVQAPVFGITVEPDDGTQDGYRWRDLHSAVAAVAGRRVRPMRLSPKLLHRVATVLALAGQRPGNAPAPMLSHGKVRELTAPEWVCSPMHGEVGTWSPRVGLHAGLSRLLLQPADQSILV